MAGPGTLLTNQQKQLGPELAPIGVADISEPQEFMASPYGTPYAEEKHLFWRFTAPQDGLYAFDTGLCTVDGSEAPEWIRADVATWSATGSVTTVVNSRPYPAGTSRKWLAYKMTAGSTVDLMVTAYSSVDAWYNYGNGGTNVPVTVRLRSNRLDSVTAEPPPEMTWVTGGATTATSINVNAGASGDGAIKAGDVLIFGTVMTRALDREFQDIALPSGIKSFFTEVTDSFARAGNQDGVIIGANITVDAPGPITLAGGTDRVTHWAVIRFTRDGVSIPLSAPDTTYVRGHIADMAQRTVEDYYNPGAGYYQGRANIENNDWYYSIIPDVPFGVGLLLHGDGATYDPSQVSSTAGVTAPKSLELSLAGTYSQVLLMEKVAEPWTMTRPLPGVGKVHQHAYFVGPDPSYSFDPYVPSEPEPEITVVNDGVRRIFS